MAEPFAIAFPSHEPNPFVEDERRLINRLIEEQLVDISYQPIVDLRSRAVFAYEAFARPGDGYFRTPGDLIDAAVRAHCMGHLGRHLRNMAIRGCQRWPIFINLNPHEFGDPFLVQPDEPVFINEKPVYLEISEAVPTDFFDQCHCILAELRKKGVLLAIDDFGAGSSSLKSIVDLRPEIVKLHRELVMGCFPGSREFDLLKSITDLCHQMDAKVIAEGIETIDELKACLAADIDYGQGFLLSVPHNPPPSFFWPPELSSDQGHYRDEFQAPRPASLNTSDSRRTAKPAPSKSLADADLISARITIKRLEDELEEAKKELTVSLEERALLAGRLKQAALSSAPRPPRERPRSPAPKVPAPAPTADLGEPKNSNEEDALDFLRRIEDERAQRENGDT
jgi:EAL domain-containing protein (putative c-di-GMP-specific phosphodiesterase class I)